MENLKKLEVWFVTGSQHLYGPAALKQVDKNSEQIAKALNGEPAIPCKVVFKPVLKGPEEITDLCIKANSAAQCVGLITWMHTFSPAKMWIAGLGLLKKPIVHLHTQFNRDLPWGAIDMDYMNLHQSAHGDREYGFMLTRMRKPRKVVVGHWKDKEVVERLAVWMR
ncbi:MAG TPA: L-arabinose isomerase, partial [Anaerohalosphaeraceae bacterium]|nr:L-arabinose isomerase [Anaerohalosphaeraceae bacterium]